MRPFVVVVGPTAVGKSDLGLELAKALGGEIISGDSVQVYRGLDIGSAKTPLAERQTIRHHLLDFLDPGEPYSVAQFQASALKLVAEIRERGHAPILVGGTGLYVRSLLDPYRFGAGGSEVIRDKWLAFMAERGREALHAALTERDPDAAERVHSNDVVRIVRALESYEITGRSLSEVRIPADRVYVPLDSHTVYIGLDAPREVLYARINLRCEEMLRQGLLEETVNLLSQGYSWRLKSLQSIGYRHAVWQLRGLATLAEALRLMQRDTRHFAKRQWTWFRRDPRITWYDLSQWNRGRIMEDVMNTCRAIETRVE